MAAGAGPSRVLNEEQREEPEHQDSKPAEVKEQ